MPLIQSSSQDSRGGKSHVSFGSNQPLRAMYTTIASPPGAPSKEGNSGPKNVPKST